MDKYQKLQEALERMTRAAAELARAKDEVDHLMGHEIVKPKRAYVRRAKNGKWSWHKRKKFAAMQKKMWETMTPEQRNAKLTAMKRGRGLK